MRVELAYGTKGLTIDLFPRPLHGSLICYDERQN